MFDRADLSPPPGVDADSEHIAGGLKKWFVTHL